MSLDINQGTAASSGHQQRNDMTFKYFREESKLRYGIEMIGGATIEQINCGSLQRIADATEKMALRHTELIAERERFETSANFWRTECDTRDKKLSAAKGQITKLKKKMAEINAALEAVKETT